MIDPTHLSYLIHDGNNNPSLSTTWRPSFFSDKGKPIGNNDLVSLPEQMILDLKHMLPERKPFDKEIFDDYPELIKRIPDHVFKFTTPSDMWVTFVDENADYTNALGYYFFSEKRKIIGNPIIIFPNTSLYWNKDSKGDLLPGMRRKLVGNNKDGQFENVHVGLFIIPNGWIGRKSGVVGQSVLYADPFLNKRGKNLTKDDHQSIFFSYKHTTLIGFEDIKLPNGDKDFNDLVISVETSKDIHTSFIPPLISTKPKSLLKKDFFGEFLRSDTLPMSFRKTLTFRTDGDRRMYNTIVNTLRFRVPIQVNDVGKTSVDITYTLPLDSRDDDGRIYLYRREENLDNTVIVTQNLTLYDLLMKYESLQENVLNLSYVLKNDNGVIVDSEVDTEVCHIDRCAVIWGDPQVKTFDDKTIQLKKPGIYELFKNKDIEVNIECDASCIKKAWIGTPKSEVAIDMDTLLCSTLHRDRGECDHITVSSVNDHTKHKDHLRKQISKCVDSQTRFITINNVYLFSFTKGLDNEVRVLSIDESCPHYTGLSKGEIINKLSLETERSR